MRRRLTRLAAALAALAALAVGGAALASAAQKSHSSSPPPVTVTQPANQTTADNPAEAPDNPAEASSSAADTDNVQQGDQSGSDAASGQAEQFGSESTASDGPGGYADANPNADTQQTGEH